MKQAKDKSLIELIADVVIQERKSKIAKLTKRKKGLLKTMHDTKDMDLHDVTDRMFQATCRTIEAAELDLKKVEAIIANHAAAA